MPGAPQCLQRDRGDRRRASSSACPPRRSGRACRPSPASSGASPAPARGTASQIFDDYGHHPVEIAAVLKAARSADQGPRHRHRAAAPLHAAARSVRRFRRLLQRCRHGDGRAGLCGRRRADRRRDSDELVPRIRAGGHRDARYIEGPAGDSRRSCAIWPSRATSSSSSAPATSPNGPMRCRGACRHAVMQRAPGLIVHRLARWLAEPARPPDAQRRHGRDHLVPRRRPGRAAVPAGRRRRPGDLPAAPAGGHSAHGRRPRLQPAGPRRRHSGLGDPAFGQGLWRGRGVSPTPHQGRRGDARQARRAPSRWRPASAASISITAFPAASAARWDECRRQWRRDARARRRGAGARPQGRGPHADQCRHGLRLSPFVGAEGPDLHLGGLRGLPGDRATIQAAMDAVQHHRETVQPIREKTGGSTFKNPEGTSAWKEIDKAGCRGLMIGGAQMSPMHCNFMINTGTATRLRPRISRRDGAGPRAGEFRHPAALGNQAHRQFPAGGMRRRRSSSTAPEPFARLKFV